MTAASVPIPRRLAELATPCLVLDRGKLARNLAAMAAAVACHGVALRPHLKTAKSVEVARLATAGQAGGNTPPAPTPGRPLPPSRVPRHPLPPPVPPPQPHPPAAPPRAPPPPP